MGIWVLEDQDRAVLYCSTSERPFGPGFFGREQAEDFLAYVEHEYRDDPRSMLPERLEAIHGEWHELTHDGEGYFLTDLILRTAWRRADT